MTYPTLPDVRSRRSPLKQLLTRWTPARQSPKPHRAGSIDSRLEPYGAPTCPRCGEHATVFKGRRYHLVCARCAEEQT